MKRVKHEEVRIASNNTTRLSTHRQVKDLVVVGISANLDGRRGLYPVCLARQGIQKSPNVFFVYVPAKLFPAENFV